MGALEYAFTILGLFVAGCIIALYIARALYRAFERMRDDRDAAAAVARIEERTHRD